MTIRNPKSYARGRGVIVVALVAALLSAVFLSPGCSMLKNSPAPVSAITVEDQTPRPDAPASIQISYAQSEDTLQSVVVSQFTGANVLRTMTSGDGEASVVRFDGGVPIWKFHANRSLLNPLSEIQKTPYHVAGIEYARVPSGFVQDAPDTGPPPPLDAGGYYIFAIERASGATSYQAVHVKSDLTLQAYDAEPRAGSSYLLCCNVSSDFAEPTPSDIEQPAGLSVAPSQDSQQP